MGFTLSDYTETLSRTDVTPESVVAVLAAWGVGGDYADWRGGFILSVARPDHKGVEIVYISGWCDTSGWGCQDGVNKEVWGDRIPDLLPGVEWEHWPGDLNKWHADKGWLKPE